MSFQIGGQMQSVPVSQAVDLNFGSHGQGASFSTKAPQLSRQSAMARASEFNGPDWSHKESFYPSDSSSYSESPAPRNYSDPEPKYDPAASPMHKQQRPKAGANSEVSLGDLIDVFVDDKFFKSHNVHYGPAVIQINGEPMGGSPSVTGSSGRGSSGSRGDSYSGASSSDWHTDRSPSQAYSPASNRNMHLSGGTNSVSIGGSTSSDNGYPHNFLQSPSPSPSPSSPASPRSIPFSPNTIGGNFTYGPIPQHGRREPETYSTSPLSFGGSSGGLRNNQQLQPMTVGAGQVISIGGDIGSGVVSFSSEPEKMLTRSDGSPVDMQSVRGLRM
ncbi:hypothetical protein BV898_16917 [Hypsibius exemplaris]|uniref:Uncharacterized protein n=1 Tax=Hypsibius exemplaris TaxID=2072580 RepID=A0A9X6NMR7_HYPEX|nr:hypothetical protein BV898_16917 [Hypsibius exemplaris]